MDIVRAAVAPPAVSVVVPLFNQGALLGDTLAAVAAQTFSDWEVVVVDDGSTDDSAAVARALVQQYTAKGMRMRLLHKVRLYTPGSLQGQNRAGGRVSTRPARLRHPWGVISCREPPLFDYGCTQFQVGGSPHWFCGRLAQGAPGAVSTTLNSGANRRAVYT